MVAPEAYELCRSCPVAEACYNHALHHEVYGMWAGLTQEDYVRVRRRERIIINIPSAVQHRLDRDMSPHGTSARWEMHYRDGEVPVRDYCVVCADARAESVRVKNSTHGVALRAAEKRAAAQKAEDDAFAVLKSLRLDELEKCL